MLSSESTNKFGKYQFLVLYETIVEMGEIQLFLFIFFIFSMKLSNFCLRFLLSREQGEGNMLAELSFFYHNNLIVFKKVLFKINLSIKVLYLLFHHKKKLKKFQARVYRGFFLPVCSEEVFLLQYAPQLITVATNQSLNVFRKKKKGNRG